MVVRASGRIILEAVVGAIAGVSILVGIALWRLSAEPVSMDFLRPHLEAAFHSEEGRDVFVGGVELKWSGFGEPLDLIARDWSVQDTQGQELAFFPEIGLRVSIPALFRGLFAPTQIEVRGVEIDLHRSADGAFGFGLAPGMQRDRPGGEADTPVDVSVFAPRLLSRLMDRPDPEDPLSYLRSISIADADIRLADGALDIDWAARGAKLIISRSERGLAGAIGFPLAAGPRDIGVLQGDFIFDRDSDEVALDLSFGGVALSTGAHFLDEAAFLSDADLTLSGRLLTTVTLRGEFERIYFDVSSSRGRLPHPPGFGQDFDIASLTASGEYDSRERLLQISDLRFALDRDGAPGIAASATANVGVTQEGIGLSAKVVAEDVTYQDILAFWPVGGQGGGRAWLEENLTAGVAEYAEVSLEAAAPERDFGAFEIRSLEGGFTYHSAEIHYLRPLPPVTDAFGTGTLDLSNITFFIESGRVGEIVGRQAVVELYDLNTSIHKTRMDLPLSAPVPEALALLNHPRLRLVEQLGIDPASTSGFGEVKLSMAFDLVSELTFDDVEISADGRLSQVTIRDFSAGQDITNGRFDLRIDKSGMTLAGPAEFAAIPIETNWSEVFKADQAYGRQIEVIAPVIDDAARLLFGLQTAPYMSGPQSAQVLIQQAPDGRGQATVISDLSDAALAFEEVKWSKAPGVPARARWVINYGPEGLISVEDISGEAPDLSFVGRAILNEARDNVGRVELSQLRLGETDLRDVVVTAEDKSISIEAGGGVLDARPWLEEDEEVAASSSEGLPPPDADDQPQEAEQPLRISAPYLDRLILGEGRSLEAVTLRLERTLRGWEILEFFGEFPRHLWRAAGRTAEEDEAIEAKRFKLSFGPQVDTGGRASHGLRLQSDDMGALLRAFDISDSIEGGQLHVRGGSDGPIVKSELSASIDARDYQMVDAPVLAKILSVATLTGIGQALDGPGLSFSRLDGDFTYHEGRIKTDLLRAYGPGLGITAKGLIDIEGSATRLSGTLVPAYALNQVLGSIPILGVLLTGGEGGGLIAVVYSVEGDLDNPEIKINPLSALAPGFLRGLFEIDGDEGEQEANRFSPTPFPEGIEGVR